MIIALLFNSDAPKYNRYYGPPIRRTVFKTEIIQGSARHMKMSCGDVCIYGRHRTWQGYDALTEATYFHGEWALYCEERLRATFRVATVYSLIFENMTQVIASQLHSALKPDDAYLGLLAVDYSYRPHLVLFRNSMITKYRIMGTTCRIFYELESVRKVYEL